MKIIIIKDNKNKITFKNFNFKKPVGILCHNYTNSVKRLALEGNNEKYYIAATLSIVIIGGLTTTLLIKTPNNNR